MNSYADAVKALLLQQDDVTLIAPCLSVRIFLDNTEPEILLDTYHKARSALGSTLTHCSTGGSFSSLNKRQETTVDGWCKKLQPWHRKNYWIAFSGCDDSRGVSASRLEVQILHRNETMLSDAERETLLKRWQRMLETNPFGYGLPCTNFRISLPLEHSLAQPDALQTWVTSLQAVSQWPFLFVVAGISVNHFYWTGNTHYTTAISNHIKSVCRRFPGLDFPMAYNALLLQYRADWLAEHRYLFPGSGRCNWLTCINQAALASLGGTTALQETLSDNPDIAVVPLSHGVMIRAGDHPALGDVAQAKCLPEYRQVTRALLPTRIATTDLLQVMSDSDVGREWFTALD